ncbi:hypothetical protein NGTWS1803_16510 [Mycolicibacterium cyprinidarum]|nr:hypothetical protein NGTWS1803_16510 [Mycolicibacterium sp. NGTWS1803]
MKTGNSVHEAVSQYVWPDNWEGLDVVTTVPDTASRLEAVLAWCGRGAVAVVLGLAVLNWVGWATGNDAVTRIFESWPPMPPWSALIQGALAVAILVQLGRPTQARIWAGRGLAAVAAVLATVFLVENLTGSSLGVDRVFFSDAVVAAEGSWPGRPSTWTAFSAALLAIGVVLTELDRRWTRIAWQLCLAGAAVLPTITALTYGFEAFLLMDATRSTGQAVGSVVSLLLMAAATVLARPDRDPVAWLLARPDRWTLIRMIGILAGLPIAVGLSRLVFLGGGLRGDAVWVLSITAGTVVVGVAVFFAIQREQRLLIEKETLSRERAQAETERAEAERERAGAETRYRILADNAVDVVAHIRGLDVVWISPSVEDAFGWPPEQWINASFAPRVHPDDLNAVGAALQGVAHSGSATVRCRVVTVDGSYRWVEARGKLYIDGEGDTDGMIFAVRIIDEQVEVEQQLQRLARFDTLTGLVNRAEALARLETAINCSRTPGTELGVLFCDIDRFKTINDTYGHTVGDAVLWTVADRISQCVRHGDTVGRTGGDEMLVLLPGLHSLDEATQIAEKIQARTAEPIRHSGSIFHATLSIGVTLAIPGESVTNTTARADAAMYQAKHDGGNTVSFT